nr:hypothetical protein [Tanacetum cinerariifolium]
MMSFDYCLNPLYPIKESSSCGALYTTDYCCSEGSLGNKIICDLNKTPDLSQQPPHNCPKCGHPVDGQYFQGCALLRRKFKEDMFTYCEENGILQCLLDASEPSNDNNNVVNALQEPFVVKQDPGAHYGYNYPPTVLSIPDLEPFNNQTIDELPQTLPSSDPICYFEDGNSFTYDSTYNIVHDSPTDFNPPPQPPVYLCEFCGDDAHYGHYCTPQDPFIYLEPGPHEAMNDDYHHEQNSCYDPNSFGFDQFQPPNKMLQDIPTASYDDPTASTLCHCKERKESLDNTLTGFENASKDLDNLLGSQRSDKNKEGLGYSVVPPSPVQIYSPPKKDLSWTGLPEFVDDTVTDYSRTTPSIDASKCNKSEL